MHRAVNHLHPPLVQPIRMSGSSLLRLTLALAVIFVAIGGTEHSLLTSALRATSRDTEGGNAPRPTSSPNSINHSNVESNNNEHVSLKGCCFDAYEFEMDQNSGNVKGRLHDHLSFCKDIQANGFVLDVIENGYSIPFIEPAHKMFRRNNKSALHNADFVSEAVSDLLSKGCVVKVKDHPYVVSFLGVAPNKSGKKRLILDLHGLNRYGWKAKVKLRLQCCSQLFSRPAFYV